MTLQLADGRKTFLDFREKAPLAATANMYLDAAGNVIKGSTTTGHLAVGVPGTVSGLEMALAKYGTMKRADLIAPAIRFAEQGFVLDQGDADMFATATEAFKVDPATRGDLPQGGRPGLRRRRQAGAEGPRGDAAPDPRGRRRRLLQGARWRARSSPRARPATASSRRPTSTSTRRASWRRSSATTAAFTSSRRRRRARAASSSARSSTSSRAIRSRIWASARRRRCTIRSRRCATPTSTATATSAIRTS